MTSASATLAAFRNPFVRKTRVRSYEVKADKRFYIDVSFSSPISIALASTSFTTQYPTKAQSMNALLDDFYDKNESLDSAIVKLISDNLFSLF